MAATRGPADMGLNRPISRVQILEQYVCRIDLRRFVGTEFGLYVRGQPNAGKIEENVSVGVEHPDALDGDRGARIEISEDV
ncbi:MAG: hypothetical protein V2J55_17645 [Candidatus Competibacteraceae bacterium]|nr:hypothetical protein [Candidatus Competibacteraceae bacterium]